MYIYVYLQQVVFGPPNMPEGPMNLVMFIVCL